MQEVFEKIKERLEKQRYLNSYEPVNIGWNKALIKTIEIVNQVAEEYIRDINICVPLTTTVRGYRVDCDVPSDYFEKIKEVRVIDEWTEEHRMFREVAEEYVGKTDKFGNSEQVDGTDINVGDIEQVCVWKPGKASDNWCPSCEPNSTFTVSGVAWFRKCPYCGKKIKVVE